MRTVPVVLLACGLAACQSSTPFEPVSDPCKALGHLSRVGQKIDSVPPSAFPEGARIIRSGTMVTRDYRPERLNVHVNDKGRIERFECG